MTLGAHGVKDIIFPGAEVTGTCEIPDEGARN